MECCSLIDPKRLLPFEAYYKYYSLNRLMRYLAMSLGLLKSYVLVGAGFRFDAFEPFRDALLQTYLLSQNLLERSQKVDPCRAAAVENQNDGQSAPKEEDLQMCSLERKNLLTCVQCLAGCVEFSGVGKEERYLAMCTEALERLETVQKYFKEQRFYKPKWMSREHEDMKKSWEDFEKDLNSKATAGDKQTCLAQRVTTENQKLKDLLTSDLDREIACLSGQEKRDMEADRQNLIDQFQNEINAMEAVQTPKDAVVAAITDNTLAAKFVERAKVREMERVLLLRRLKMAKEKEWLKKSRTARASEPVLYRSHGPNSYSASRRPESANTHQKEKDPLPWNPWKVDKSQFLLSASRSIGVLRASRGSEGFNFDAFQPFFGALRDTFNLCDKHLKRNETEEEYLTVSERNTLLAGIVALAGCVTFTGVAKDEKYNILCKAGLDKLEDVVAKLSGAGYLEGADKVKQQEELQKKAYEQAMLQQQALQQQVLQQQALQQAQTQQNFNQQPQQNFNPQPQQYFNNQSQQFFHTPNDYWSQGLNGGQAYYGQPMGLLTPFPYPGRTNYTPNRLQNPSPGHQ